MLWGRRKQHDLLRLALTMIVEKKVRPMAALKSIDLFPIRSIAISGKGLGSGCLHNPFPFRRRQINQLPTQRLELRRPVVVFDVLRKMRDGIDQTIR